MVNVVYCMLDELLHRCAKTEPICHKEEGFGKMEGLRHWHKGLESLSPTLIASLPFLRQE